MSKSPHKKQCKQEARRRKRRKEEARRKEWMKRKQAWNGADLHAVESAKDIKGENMLNEHPEEQGVGAAKVHRLVNDCARTAVGDSFMNEVALAMLQQMEGGYRLTFPVVMAHGRTLRCVALLVLAQDPRLKAVRRLQVPPEATHVFVFLAFTSESDWLRQAGQITRLFPEQRNKSEFIIAEK